jgi:alkylation response protein AidB-like acyl-CoA dehydrogenase
MVSSVYARALEELSSDHQEVVRLVARFAKEQVAPLAADIDATNEFPKQLYDAASSIGLVGLLLPEDAGGVDMPLAGLCLIYEEIAAASATLAVILSNSIEAIVPLVKFTSEPLRAEVIERVLSRGEIPCFALTEPGAGSDATAITTRAERVDDGWVLNGRKVFITNGAYGSLYSVYAVTDHSASKGKRLSAFLVNRDDEGFSVGANEKTMGLRGSPLTELIIENVRVDDSRLLGEVGQGVAIMMGMLNEARVGAAAQCVGIARDALERATAYASDRRAFGAPIATHQAVQLMLADMWIRTEASRTLTLAAARAHERGAADARSLAAGCKAFASDAAVDSTLDAIQIHGGYGYCEDFGVERLLRDAKAYQIFDGTNQIQRINIARRLAPRRR